MLNALIAVLMGSGIALFVWFAMRPVISWIRGKRAISPLAAKNMAREKGLLDKMIKDIRADTDAWFLHERAGQGYLLANDKKCIGISYHGTEHLTILLNLKAVTNFKEHEADTVKISMRGNHVTKFLREAEQLIDKRGSEIRFFADEFDKRI